VAGLIGTAPSHVSDEIIGQSSEQQLMCMNASIRRAAQAPDRERPGAARYRRSLTAFTSSRPANVSLMRLGKLSRVSSIPVKEGTAGFHSCRTLQPRHADVATDRRTRHDGPDDAWRNALASIMSERASVEYVKEAKNVIMVFA
jgi:hypothetical protein